MLPPSDRPRLTPEAEQAQQARTEREAAALRANLLRRKQQQRAREAEQPGVPPPDKPS